MELPGTVLFWGKLNTQSFLCQVLGWMGQLCVGVFFGFFFSCYFVWVSFLFFNNVYNLPQSLCLL